MASHHGCLSPSETIFLDHTGTSLLLPHQSLYLESNLEPYSFSYHSFDVFQEEMASKCLYAEAPCRAPPDGGPVSCSVGVPALWPEGRFTVEPPPARKHRAVRSGIRSFGEKENHYGFTVPERSHLPSPSHFKTTYFETIPVPMPSSSLVTFMVLEHDSLAVSTRPAGEIIHGSPAEHASPRVCHKWSPVNAAAHHALVPLGQGPEPSQRKL